ncbi:MAG: primosomal protein N' [Planctomycetaceae bacterium]|jgi:primosomal protein N' (replication factor Y)|nr:primosomal protein N' [Planctomycetaceae bacterium]
MTNVQRNLFHNSPPDWEQDDVPTELVARVVFPKGVDGAFDYRVPQRLAAEISAGLRVTVPLGRGNRETLGYCIDAAHREVKTQWLKEMISIVDSQRLLSDKMLRLTEWIADYYLCPQGQVLEAVLPVGVRDHAGTRLASVLYVPDDYQQKLAALAKIPDAKSVLLTRKQQQVFDTLRLSETPLTANELSRAAKCSMAPIQHLKRLGLFRVRTERRQKPAFDDVPAIPRESPYELNPPQKACFEKICEALRRNEHCTFLLHGVTGSGKTEVYIRTIDEVVRNGRQAVILVPEISLTPQTVGRFRSRFDHVAVLHSHLADAERNREWRRIASGSVQVVVGARSAVFAPLPNLGVIIIDEEHESSFKQDTAPRYHAREVAKRRAEEEQATLILGSATPSLESWRRAAITKEYTLLSMPYRVRNLSLPHVSTIDLRTADRDRNTRGAIHRRLHAAIDETLSQNGQAILMLNRRGFSTHIQCPACGEVVKCPDCEVSLTHHQTANVAVCHYCDYQIPAPSRCPKCAFPGIRYSGFGTQKLEQELKQRFPDVPLLRMDTDTMQGHGAHEKALSQFREGKVRILLGTQMIAKGLDFPNVTLVGVISADTALHLPDFRAAERTFHLITQVAGRTGRGERGGQVVVQTFNPDHAAICAAAQHDYLAFVKSELPMREALGYPPYSRMARFIVRGPNENAVIDFAKRIADSLRRQTAEIGLKCRVLGPAPAPFAKLRGNYRYHIHVHYANDFSDQERMRNVIRLATVNLKPPTDTLWIVDIDPLDML